jgi:hypothetical protein
MINQTEFPDRIFNLIYGKKAASAKKHFLNSIPSGIMCFIVGIEAIVSNTSLLTMVHHL